MPVHQNDPTPPAYRYTAPAEGHSTYMEDLARVFLRSFFPRPYTTPLAPTPHLNPLPQPGTPNPLPPNRHHGSDQQPTSPTPPHKVTAIDPTTDSIQTITTQRGQREGRSKTSQLLYPPTTTCRRLNVRVSRQHLFS